MKLTRSHLFFILLITIMSVAFLPDLIEGLENLSSQDRKHTLNEYYKERNVGGSTLHHKILYYLSYNYEHHIS